MTCSDFRRYITPYIDHEISLERAVQLEEHVGTCPKCSRRLQAEQWAAESVRRYYSRVPCPPELEHVVRRALKERGPVHRWVRPAVAVAGLATLGLLSMFVGIRHATSSLPPRVALAAELYEQLVQEELFLPVRSRDVAELDRWLAQHLYFYAQGTLRPAAERFVAVGASVVHHGGEALGAVAYQSPSGPTLLLIAPVGPERTGDETVRLGNSMFRTFTQGRRKFVSWSHGTLSYVLVSNGEHDGARACASCHSGVRSDRLAEFPSMVGEL